MRCKIADGNGIDFIREVKAKYPLIEIILLTAYGNIPDGIQAMKNGAFDYIVKGDDNNKIIPLLNKAIEKVELKKKIASLEKQVGKIIVLKASSALHHPLLQLLI